MYNLKKIAMVALVTTPTAVHSFAPPQFGSSGRVVDMHQQQQHANSRPMTIMPLHVSSTLHDLETMYFAKEATPQVSISLPATTEEAPEALSVTPPQKKPVAAKAKKPVARAKEGPLSPVVLAAKAVMGNDVQFNKLRAKVISLHSEVIEGFVVGNSDTTLGKAVLKRLFDIADANHNGIIEEIELKSAFQTVGFEWLKEKQVHGIFERADKNHNGELELEEWLAEAPKTLRTNLIKLAKKNGGELGLLA